MAKSTQRHYLTNELPRSALTAAHLGCVLAVSRGHVAGHVLGQQGARDAPPLHLWVVQHRRALCPGTHASHQPRHWPLCSPDEWLKMSFKMQILERVGRGGVVFNSCGQRKENTRV